MVWTPDATHTGLLESAGRAWSSSRRSMPRGLDALVDPRDVNDFTHTFRSRIRSRNWKGSEVDGARFPTTYMLSRPTQEFSSVEAPPDKRGSRCGRRWASALLGGEAHENPTPRCRRRLWKITFSSGKEAVLEIRARSAAVAVWRTGRL